jgi:hypothetical protein
MIAILVAATTTMLVAVGATSGCGGGECQVQGENCSQAYREANGIDYDCCDGLTCSQNSLGDLVCR